MSDHIGIDRNGYETPKVVPMYEDCEMCDGTGFRKYSASYIDGDLYQDGEVLPCDECGGSGKILITNQHQ